jgi:hypothetical protein
MRLNLLWAEQSKKPLFHRTRQLWLLQVLTDFMPWCFTALARTMRHLVPSQTAPFIPRIQMAPLRRRCQTLSRKTRYSLFRQPWHCPVKSNRPRRLCARRGQVLSGQPQQTWSRLSLRRIILRISLDGDSLPDKIHPRGRPQSPHPHAFLVNLLVYLSCRNERTGLQICEKSLQSAPGLPHLPLRQAQTLEVRRMRKVLRMQWRPRATA